MRKIRGQEYDGAANMSGAYGGVQAGRKNGKKRGRKKKEEREKKKIWRKHVITVKTKMEHLSCGALTHNLACWRPCPFWRKRRVR